MPRFIDVFRDFFRRWWYGYGGVAKDMVREIGICVGILRKDPFDRQAGLFEWAYNTIPFEKHRRLNLFMSTAFYLEIDDLDDPENKAMYDRIFYDFDSDKSPDKAVEKALEFAKSIKARFGCDAVVSFSGLHGAHITIPVKRPIRWREYAAAWKMLVAPYRFSDFVDMKVFEPKRIYRVPYTYNVKEDGTGFSYIIKHDGSRMKAEEFDWSLYEPLDASFLSGIVDIDTPVLNMIKVSSKNIKTASFKKAYDLPRDPADLDKCDAVPICMKNIISTFKSAGDIDHYQRLALVLYLKWLGYSVDEAVNLFSRFAKDFNERITRYQVEYAYGLRGRKENWMFPSCRWFKQNNMCIGCGWGERHSNPVTYTYTYANVSDDIKSVFFDMASKKRVGE